MLTCLDCGSKLLGASLFCAYCGHVQGPLTETPPDALTVLIRSVQTPRPPRNEKEGDKQRGPTFPPILPLADLSEGIPKVAETPYNGECSERRRFPIYSVTDCPFGYSRCTVYDWFSCKVDSRDAHECHRSRRCQQRASFSTAICQGAITLPTRFRHLVN